MFGFLQQATLRRRVRSKILKIIFPSEKKFITLPLQNIKKIVEKEGISDPN